MPEQIENQTHGLIRKASERSFLARKGAFDWKKPGLLVSASPIHKRLAVDNSRP